jgi:branched-chain amino acid transport system ATP-binding protein
MLEIEGLSVHYDGIQALSDVTLEVKQGELVALVGANGAGKTTLLRTISGLVRPSAGEVRFEGRSVGGRSAEKIARAGLVHVPEGRRIFPRLTVRENLLVAGWGRRTGRTANLARVDSLFPILAERSSQYAYTLSGGEQQMLAIGRALMREPRLLMLDDPSLGLAPKVVRDVFDLIGTIRASGVTLLLVEQNANMALELADRAYVLERGEVRVEGVAAELAASDDIRRAYLGHV